MMTALLILSAVIGVLIGWLFGFACGLVCKREVRRGEGSPYCWYGDRPSSLEEIARRGGA